MAYAFVDPVVKQVHRIGLDAGSPPQIGQGSQFFVVLMVYTLSVHLGFCIQHCVKMNSQSGKRTC
jgi:hypothetical protein